MATIVPTGTLYQNSVAQPAVIPTTGQVSMSNFWNAPYSYLSTQSLYLPTMAYPASNALDYWGGGLGSYNTWSKRYSDVYATFTTPNWDSSVQIKVSVSAGSYQVGPGQTYFYDPYSTWYRNDRVGGPGIAVFNSVGTLIKDSSLGTGDQNIYYNGSYQAVYPPAITNYSLLANTTYNVKYSGYFYKEDSGGYASNGDFGIYSLSQPYITVTVGG